MMEQEKKDVVIRISGLRKVYRLGQIGTGTLQGDIKEWRARRKRKAEGAGTDSTTGTEKYAGADGSSGSKGQAGAERITALDGIDLTVCRGETLGIIGRNGAGKSTLLKIISRITAPTEGTVELYGRVSSMLEVGTGFHGEMTGRENIFLNGAIMGMTKEEIQAKIEDITRFSEVEKFIDTPVKRYSSGMYVKLGFAVAAHLDSEIMIMDEVLAVGDMEFQHKCLDRMRKAAVEEGKTILYVSHNMSTIRRLCSRCIVLDAGKIIYDGDVDEATAIYLGAGGSLGSRYEFSDEYRPYDQWLRLNRRFNMDSIELVNAPSAVFGDGDRPELLLRCTADIPLKRVGFRFELWFQDGVKVGTMLAGSFADMHPGENEIRLRMDLQHLTSGQYHADLVAYLFDEDGNEDILDGVYPGFRFRVKREAGGENYLDWHHQYWGDIRLHDLEILPDSGTEG